MEPVEGDTRRHAMRAAGIAHAATGAVPDAVPRSSARLGGPLDGDIQDGRSGLGRPRWPAAGEPVSCAKPGGANMYRIGSELEQVALEELRPTQMTVGMRAVMDKSREWNELPERERSARMAGQLFAAVKGAHGSYFILDGHHTALALFNDKARQVQIGLVSDLSHLSEEEFWVFLDHRSWVHCYDRHGRRQPLGRMPTRLQDLVDDPYRSLAASVQKEGGFCKPEEPFFEFLWANHFRNRIDSGLVEKWYEEALRQALDMSHSGDCSHLPGWVRGPSRGS